MSQCTNCASELQPQARFCSVCSYPVGKADARPSAPQEAPAWPQPPAPGGDAPAGGESAAPQAPAQGAPGTPPLQPNFGTGVAPLAPLAPPAYQAAQAFPAGQVAPQAFPGGPAGPPKTDGQAIAALVCGIAGILFCPLILSIVAIVLGRTSKTRIRQSQGALEGESMANAGFILGIAGLVIGVLIIGVAILVPVFMGMEGGPSSPMFP